MNKFEDKTDKKVKISITNLKKNFGSKEVLRGVDLDIYEGESLVIIGGSGCGKTVLIKILSTLIEKTSGEIKVDDTEISSFNEKQKKEYILKISFLFQLNALFDSYPIWKNICISNIENEKMKKEEAIKLAKEKLQSVDLKDEVAYLYPSDISGGMQKRVALARCLTSTPEIIFFDEPTSGLDPLTSMKISELIRSVKGENGKEITKISIMHDIECASVVADRIVFFLDGKVEWIGTPLEMESSTNENLLTFVRRNGIM
jgi:phospholipid/cholesterol/gamma-HCH transport system ATP-binding protein